jgi:uncharacterized protein DUF1883
MQSGRPPESSKTGPPAHTPAPQRTGPPAHPAAPPPPHPSVPEQSGPPPFVAHYAFPFARQADRVKVDIDTNANVLLVNDEGLEAYRRHAPFHYIGGGFGPGAHVLGVPATGSWHIVIDLGGRSGHVTHHAAITHHPDTVGPPH